MLCQVVFTVDRGCQLLGAGLCGTEGGFTVELEIYEVAADDFSRELCTLSVSAQSFTKVAVHACEGLRKGGMGVDGFRLRPGV